MMFRALSVGTLLAAASPAVAQSGDCGDVEGSDRLDPLLTVHTYDCDKKSPITNRDTVRHISDVELYLQAVRRKTDQNWTTVVYLDGELSRGQSRWNGYDNRGAPLMTEARLLIGETLFDLPVNNSRWELKACPSGRIGSIYAAACYYRFFGAFKITEEIEEAFATATDTDVTGRIVLNTGEELDIRFGLAEWKRLLELRSTH